MKKIISNILFGIVITISGYLLIANIIQIIQSSEYEVFDANNNVLIEAKNELLQAKNKNTQIQNLKLEKLSDEEMKSIKSNANDILETLKNDNILTLADETKLYKKDLLELYITDTYGYMNYMNILNTLEKYYPEISSFKDLYINQTINNMYQNTKTELYFTYDYHMEDMFLSFLVSPNNYNVNSMIMNYHERVSSANYIFDLILKAGDTNE